MAGKWGEGMSVIVKGFKMPECCDVCTFSAWSNLSQTASCMLLDYQPCFKDYDRSYIKMRSDRCPLIDLDNLTGRDDV